MIAVAGAKGGCGKTVTTLGLIDAFARAGTPSVAVDADRQLPSLHVIGDVDREPTLGAFDPERGVNPVSQQNPRADSSGLIAAPLEEETVDMTRTLSQLDRPAMQVLVDCPPGAGQDVAEALAAVDRVVVVTTDRPGGIESAHTTVDLARRLEVPVAGLVLNRCTTPSRELRSAFDLPVLATIPERSSPLSDPGVRAACDTVTATLRGESDTAEPGGQHRPQRGTRLPTGVPTLDRTLGGGFFPGTIIAVSGPTDRTERFLGQLPTERDALFLTTHRSERTVEKSLASADTGITRLTHLDDENPIAEAKSAVEQAPDGATLVVDAVDALESGDRAAYLDFLNHLVMHVGGTSRVAVLHCRQHSESTNRATTERFADTVLEL